MPALKPFTLNRIVALPQALDALPFGNALALRVAPDELFIDTEIPSDSLEDAHAIITRDTSLHGAWLSAGDAADFLIRECRWRLPETRPAFAQGAVAHLPVKLYLETTRVLILVAAVYAAELEPHLLHYKDAA